MMRYDGATAYKCHFTKPIKYTTTSGRNRVEMAVEWGTTSVPGADDFNVTLLESLEYGSISPSYVEYCIKYMSIRIVPIDELNAA